MSNKRLDVFLGLVQEIQKSLKYIFPNLEKFGTLNLCYNTEIKTNFSDATAEWLSDDKVMIAFSDALAKLLSDDGDLEKLCLDFNGYTIFPAKIEHKTIAGKKLADGFKLYYPDGELIQDIFSVSGAVSLFAKVVFDEIFKVYEDRVQSDALAEFLKEEPQLSILFRSNN
jgi:hypothetical protein